MKIKFKENLFPRIIDIPYDGGELGYNGGYILEDDVIHLASTFHPIHTSMYRVLVHELMHATAHHSRLNRHIVGISSEDIFDGDIPYLYSLEELKAEFATYHLLQLMGGLTQLEKQSIQQHFKTHYDLINGIEITNELLNELSEISSYFLVDECKHLCYTNMGNTVERLLEEIGVFKEALYV